MGRCAEGSSSGALGRFVLRGFSVLREQLCQAAKISAAHRLVTLEGAGIAAWAVRSQPRRFSSPGVQQGIRLAPECQTQP